MLVNADAKGLEWVCAALLSQDQTAIREILNGEDQHSDNERRFGLPSRLVAKTFLFRIIYGGNADGFERDPNFGTIGDKSFWNRAINAFYDKYQGMAQWHRVLVERATEYGEIVIPTGRKYTYPQRELVRSENSLRYWRPKILNYCVQGFGAELMALARVNLFNAIRINKLNCMLINTVHDSILIDSPDNEWYNILTHVKSAFEDVPATMKELFNYDMNLPMRVEIKFGKDWTNMEEIEV